MERNAAAVRRRLHREYSEKKDIRIYDYIEHDHLQLARMWKKRQLGYRAMGYQILPDRI